MNNKQPSTYRYTYSYKYMYLNFTWLGLSKFLIMRRSGSVLVIRLVVIRAIFEKLSSNSIRVSEVMVIRSVLQYQGFWLFGQYKSQSTRLFDSLERIIALRFCHTQKKQKQNPCMMWCVLCLKTVILCLCRALCVFTGSCVSLKGVVYLCRALCVFTVSVSVCSSILQDVLKFEQPFFSR